MVHLETQATPLWQRSLFCVALFLSYALSFNILPQATHLVYATYGVLAALGLGFAWSGGRKGLASTQPVLACALIFVAVGTFGWVTLSGTNFTGLHRITTIVPLIPAYYAVLILAFERSDLRDLTTRFVLAALCLEILVAIVLFAFRLQLSHQTLLKDADFGLYKWRMAGLNRNSSELGMKMLLLAGLAFVRLRRAWAYPLGGAALLVAAGAFSRSSVLAIACLLGLVAVSDLARKLRLNRKQVLGAAAILAGVGLAAVALSWETLWSSNAAQSLHVRGEFVKRAWTVISASPWIGNSNFRFYVTHSSVPNVLNHPHNFHVFTVASYGVFYYAAFLFALAHATLRSGGQKLFERVAFLLVYLFVQNMFQLQLHYPAGFADLVFLLIVSSSGKRSDAELT